MWCVGRVCGVCGEGCEGGWRPCVGGGGGVMTECGVRGEGRGKTRMTEGLVRVEHHVRKGTSKTTDGEG